jgi:hypothetical protein
VQVTQLSSVGYPVTCFLVSIKAGEDFNLKNYQEILFVELRAWVSITYVTSRFSTCQTQTKASSITNIVVADLTNYHRIPTCILQIFPWSMEKANFGLYGELGWESLESHHPNSKVETN